MGLYNPVSLQTQTISGNATLKIVPANTSPGNLLAANPSRVGATIFNASTANLFINFGTNTLDSTNNFAAKIIPGGYYEVPVTYTGIIAGVWDANAPNTSAKVLEFS